MSAGIVQAAYIVAAVLFIMSLAGLSKQETARKGNYFGMAGMAIALIATIFYQTLKLQFDHFSDDHRWCYRYFLCEKSRND